ncbi:MAG: hypothetical protein ACKVT0_10535 [Planctomycetaceae bacterium]
MSATGDSMPSIPERQLSRSRSVSLRSRAFVMVGLLASAGLVAWSLSRGDIRADDAPAKDAKKKIADLRTPESIKIQEALAEFNSLIGDWRGVGMVKRNSTSGAWKEAANWIWDFDTTPIGIRYEVQDGKLLSTAHLSFDPEAKVYTLKTVSPDKVERSYSGTLDDKNLVLETKSADDEDAYRMTITRLNEKRTLVLHEKRKANQTFFSRVAEVGYTREGTRLAEPGAGEPECLVTGGYGSMKVMFGGETYYVCCTGCLQAFQADPAGVVADYKKKLADRKKASSK